VIFADDIHEEEKAAFYAACDVFVSVSSAESFGIIYLEAWASGKPVIGSRIPAVESVISEGQDGLLVTCGNVVALSAAIMRLLNDEPLRTTLAVNGKEKVRANFTSEITTRKLRSIYEQVINAACNDKRLTPSQVGKR
jgi:glycosyltransferase involved in cell wall biosynthesis